MRVETIIIGAGQAGLALSHHLARRRAHGHVVLERGRVGERWRSERWDSLAPAHAELAQPAAGRARRCPTRTATSTATA